MAAEPPPLTLADVRIEGTNLYEGASLVPLLRLGGPEALRQRIGGLADLLTLHDELNEDELIFVRETLRDLANRLFEDPDEAIAPVRSWRIVPHEAVEEAPPPADDAGTVVVPFRRPSGEGA
jgi:hypothetical protein